MLDFRNRQYYVVGVPCYEVEEIIDWLKDILDNIKVHFNKYGEHNLKYSWKFIVSAPKTELDLKNVLIDFERKGQLTFREIVPRQRDDVTVNSSFINEAELYERKEIC